MEISPLENDLYGEALPLFSPFWERAGKVAWVASSAIACMALAGFVLGKKKRNLSIMFTSVPPIMSPLTLPELERNPSPYDALPCTAQDREHIAYIIDALSSWGYIIHAFETKHRGAQIEQLHPFKFLETIFCDPELRKKMPTIMKHYAPRHGFLNGVQRGIMRERDREGEPFLQYLEEFAKRLGVSAANVKQLIESSKWEELVSYLIENTSEPRA